MTLPNLDTMTIKELWGFFYKYKRGGKRKDKEELIGDGRLGYTLIANDIANYACNKAVAIECREGGKIVQAKVYELICDRIYDQLPSDLKW